LGRPQHLDCVEMAGCDGPSRPPGQLSLLDFRLGLERAPPDVDRAEIEAQVQARRQVRLQREEDTEVVEGPAVVEEGPLEMPPDAFW
jgi:hypothetical protein